MIISLPLKLRPYCCLAFQAYNLDKLHYERGFYVVLGNVKIELLFWLTHNTGINLLYNIIYAGEEENLRKFGLELSFRLISSSIKIL